MRLSVISPFLSLHSLGAISTLETIHPMITENVTPNDVKTVMMTTTTSKEAGLMGTQLLLYLQKVMVVSRQLKGPPLPESYEHFISTEERI